MRSPQVSCPRVARLETGLLGVRDRFRPRLGCRGVGEPEPENAGREPLERARNGGVGSLLESRPQRPEVELGPRDAGRTGRGSGVLEAPCVKQREGVRDCRSVAGHASSRGRAGFLTHESCAIECASVLGSRTPGHPRLVESRAQPERGD